MRIVHFVLVAPLLATVAAADAAMLNAKPGLWESSTTSKMEGGLSPQMPDLSKLPADQRARVEQSLAARGSGRAATSIARQCVTPQMLEKWETFVKGEGNGDCRSHVLEQSQSHVKMTVSCSNGKSVGDMEFTAVSNDRVTGKMAMVMHTDNGDRKMNVEVASRWLGADCGTLKPGERRPVSGG